MRFRIHSLVLISGFAAIGCEPAATTPSGVPRATQQAGREIREAARATGDALREQRDKFVNSAREELKDLDRKLEDLQNRLANATGDARDALVKQIDKIKLNRSDVENWMKRANDATAEQWDNVKDGFNDAMRRLKDMFK